MSTSNQAQIDIWNGRVGEKWAAMQVSLDAMLAHATAELVVLHSFKSEGHLSCSQP